jgi:hypothetical protein
MAKRPSRHRNLTNPQPPNPDVTAKCPAPPLPADQVIYDADGDRNPSQATLDAIEADMTAPYSAERLWSALKEACDRKHKPFELLGNAPLGADAMNPIPKLVQALVRFGHAPAEFPEGFWDPPRTGTEGLRRVFAVQTWMAAHNRPPADGKGTTPADGGRNRSGQANRDGTPRSPDQGDGAPDGPEVGPSNQGPHRIILAGVDPEALEQLATVTARLPDAPIKWSRPNSVSCWAKVFAVHRNTMSVRLRTGRIRAEQFGARLWCVDIRALPAARRAEFR